MRSCYLTIAAAAVATSVLTASTTFAAPLLAFTPMQAKTPGLTTVQYRHWQGRPPAHHHHDGSAAAAVVGGLVVGAIIGGAVASSQARAVAACAQRYRSYDRASGTYLGYDGFRHPCP